MCYLKTKDRIDISILFLFSFFFHYFRLSFSLSSISLFFCIAQPPPRGARLGVSFSYELKNTRGMIYAFIVIAPLTSFFGARRVCISKKKKKLPFAKWKDQCRVKGQTIIHQKSQGCVISFNRPCYSFIFFKQKGCPVFSLQT